MATDNGPGGQTLPELPRDHVWFREENEEEFGQYASCMPDLLRRGWKRQVAEYAAALHQILVRDVSERAAVGVAKLVEEDHGYASKTLTYEHADSVPNFSFSLETTPDRISLPRSDGLASRGLPPGIWEFQWAENSNKLIPPQALCRLSHVEAWIERQGAKEWEKALFPRRVWVSTPRRPDPILWVGLGKFLVSVYEWG